MAIQRNNDEGLRELALFAGAGGGILGGMLLGWRTICAVELDPYAASVLVARQNDGVLPPFPIWDDVRTFDGRPWRGIVDVISGGFPCQDISVAGTGKGLSGERSGLWTEFARIIGEVRPRFVFVENSPALTSRGLGRVLGDLAEMGYDAEWCVLGAHHVGAPHRRDRIWILAYIDGLRQQQQERGKQEIGRWIGDCIAPNATDSNSLGCDRRTGMQRTSGRAESSNGACNAPNINSARCKEQRKREPTESGYQTTERCGWWSTEPGLVRMVHGIPYRVDRIKALGNGQVPAVAARAWTILSERIGISVADA